jgi:hypothetical protein
MLSATGPWMYQLFSKRLLVTLVLAKESGYRVLRGEKQLAGIFQALATLSTILFTAGITTREIGMLTNEPTMKPRSHISQKRSVQPLFTSTRMKVMIRDITTEVRAANNIPLYFLFILKATSFTHKKPSSVKKLS